MKKNILLIGGSGGIGLEIVKLISAENNVFVASRTRGALEELNVDHLEFDVLKG
jgi:3-oxoacyl-[acyl-carrier protein] reductase